MSNVTINICNSCEPRDFSNIRLSFFEQFAEILEIEHPSISTQPEIITDGNLKRLSWNNVFFESGERKEIKLKFKFVELPDSPFGNKYDVNLRVTVEGRAKFDDKGIFPVDIPSLTNTSISAAPASILPPGGSCGSLDPLYVEINGTLVVDEDYCFGQDNLLVMGPNARIVVQNGNTLELNGVEMYSCEEMWDRILIEDGGELVVNGSTISDAKTAIEARPGSTLTATSSSFFNNKIGIVFGYDFFQPYPQFINHFLHDLQFTSDGSLKAPYSGARPEAGINALFGSVTLSGENTVFSGLQRGISIWGTHLALFGGISFEDCSMEGIYSQGGGNWLISIGQNGIAPSFVDCGTAISSQGNNAVIRDNEVSLSNTGIYLNENAAVPTAMYLYRNQIESGLPILIQAPKGHSLGEIVENEIDVISFENSSSAFAGITVQHPNFEAGKLSWSIQGNQIDVRDGRYGMNLTASGLSIRNNTIDLQEETTGQVGIYTAGGSNHSLSCNDIFAAGNCEGGTPGDATAIRVDGTFGNVLSCNQVDATRYGINFWGMSDNTTLQGNTIQAHCSGLLLGNPLNGDGNAFISSQPHRGNIWNSLYQGAGSSNGTGARHLATTDVIISFSEFVVDDNPMSGGNQVFLPSIELESGTNIPWFNIDIDNQNQLFQCQPANTCPDGVGTPPANELSLLDERIMLDSLLTEGYDASLGWTAARHLYQRTQTESYTQPADQAGIQSFLAGQQFSLVDELYSVGQGMRSSGALTAADSTRLRTLNGLVKERMYELVRLDSLMTVDSVNFQLHFVQKGTVLDALGAFTAELDSLHEQAETMLVQDLAAVRTTLTGLGGSAVYEQNARTVNSLLAEMMMVDSLTESARTTLTAIANQCPLDGGDAVFQARAILEPAMYKDAINCTPVELREDSNWKESSLDSKFAIYPNPASGPVTLLSNHGCKTECNGRLSLFDIHGSKLVSYSLDLAIPSQQIDLRELPAGMYLFQITQDGRPVFFGRIILKN